jgi:hypothetical protein
MGPAMSKKDKRFYVYGAPVWCLLENYRARMRSKVLRVSLANRHSAQVIDLANWKAAKNIPN